MNNIDTLKANAQGPCISITIATDPVNKKKNYEMLKKAIESAKVLLKREEVTDEIREHLNKELDRCVTHLQGGLTGGLGIYISPQNKMVIHFPFDVKLNVIIDDNFELRDVLYLQQYGETYYLLNLSKKGAHLFEGTFNRLTEVQDGNFPLYFKDEFEYQRASIANSSSSSLKSFEKDKNQIGEIRIKAVFREADSLLKSRLMPGARVILAGTQRMISVFTSITTLGDKIVSKVRGSYNETNFTTLCDAAWASMVKARKKEILNEIKHLEEKNGYIAQGLQQAWNAAVEGKGLMLLVEKDLHHRAYRNDQESKIYLQPPGKSYSIVPDAVDSLIETVKSKNGKVLFTENNQLKDFDHVALVLRY